MATTETIQLSSNLNFGSQPVHDLKNNIIFRLNTALQTVGCGGLEKTKIHKTVSNKHNTIHLKEGEQKPRALPKEQFWVHLGGDNILNFPNN